LILFKYMDLKLSTKRSKLIILGLLFFVFVGAGGYLLWRVNQPETVAPEDSEAYLSTEYRAECEIIAGSCRLGIYMADTVCVGTCVDGGWTYCDSCDTDTTPTAPTAEGRSCDCGTDKKYCDTCTDWQSCLDEYGCCDCHGWKSSGSCYNCSQYAICGSLDGKNFSYTITNWPSTDFCGDGVYGGTPSPASPAFPQVGKTTTWQCVGAARTVNCSASRQALPTYTVTYKAGENGSLTGTKVQTVSRGGSTTQVTAVPDTDYYFGGWSDGKSTNPRKDTNVTGNITVTATFSLSCGNGTCEADENAQSCPADCDANCGDGYCTHDETVLTCPDDCAANCGDGYCTHDETNETCPEDCSADCGDDYCDPETETAANCPADCDPNCGDGYCTHDEDVSTCPEDCASVCGDGQCTHNETSANCPEDCGPATSGGVPSTGIFDDSKTAMISGFLLIFLGFTWRILGRGIYVSVEFLGKVPKKVSIQMKDVKEDIRAKRRIREMRVADKRKKNFERKVVKD
jgi:hypothetical protein